MNSHLCWESKQPYDCFYYVIKGMLRLTIEDEDCILNPDDVLFLSSRDHAWMCSEGDEGISYYYVSFYSYDNFDLNLKTVYRRTDAGDLFREILMAHRSVAPLSRLRLSQLFLKLICLLASHTAESQQMNNTNSRIQAAVEYINLKYDEQITIQQLCHVANYSASHLRRLFVSTYGISPQEYIIRKRIDAAKERLLEYTESSIETVALSLGFSSTSYFCKQFRKHVGITPLTYQKNGKT